LHRSARLCHCSLLSTGHLRDVHSFPTRRSSDLDWRADMQRGEKWYDNYTIEVVDQVGFDSLQADSGVLLAKTRDDETSPNIWIIDSHPEDIDLINYQKADGDIKMLSKGDQEQQADALFTAGTAPGVFSEHVDEYNRLHFYVLNNHKDDDGALSYRVAVRHLDGDGDFERGVEVNSGETERAWPGRVSVHHFPVTNTGEETDLIRVQADSDWETMIEHNVIEVAAGETVDVPVYVKVPEEATTPETLTITATSETDSNQTKTVHEATFNDIS